jgi:DUF4097 and DUF4098 domain-containing protein YvlB
MPISTKHLFILVLTITVALPATTWADKDYTTVNKSVRIDEGEFVGDIESVNGAINVGADAVAKSIRAVNGAIKISEDVKIERNVQAVNGAIKLAQGADVGGNVETVNGTIRVQASAVAGDVETVNGDIRLLAGTLVEGSVLVKKPSGWSSNRKPVKVELGEDVQVYGDLIFEHPVELKIHKSASFREMIGEDIKVIEG